MWNIFKAKVPKASNKLYVNGKVVAENITGELRVDFEGDMSSLDTTNVTINGSVHGPVDGTNITIKGDVTGDVDGTNITAGNITGNVDGTNISCKRIN